MFNKSLILAVLLSSTVAIADNLPVNPLEGTWEWVNIKNGCNETYIFAADGSSHITSGTEVSDASYILSEKPSVKGFYKVTLKILKDKGGKDCSEDVSDSTGQEYTNYLAFHPAGNQYVVCEKESIDSCIGPLKRAQ
jgi:hypothetical protein